MALTPGERTFLYGHARNYARPDVDPARADAYAQWYLDRYADPDATIDDMPAHTHAWPKFLTGQKEA